MPFLGMPIRAGGAIYFTAEEHNDEFDFRAHQIANGIIVPEEAIRYPFEVVSRAGEDALLCRFTKAGVLEPTPLWTELVERIGDLKCAFVGIDPAADVYGGNEIDRAQVRAFINMLRKPAIEHKCAILLAGHASVDGLKTGRGYSGSTAWHNSVRARWYFRNPTADDNEDEADPNLRELSLRKTNRGKAGQRLLLRWHEGWFGLDGGGASQPAKEAQAKERFLILLARFQSEGRRVSPNKGPTYAPACFEQHPNGKPFKGRQYHEAMDALLAEGQLRVVTDGSPSRQRSYLVQA
jgi:RecA-family ATPase